MSSGNVWLMPVRSTVTLVTVPDNPATEMFEGYGDPAALSRIVMAAVFDRSAPHVGVGLAVAVAVAVKVAVAVFVAVPVFVGVKVFVGVGDAVAVLVGVLVFVAVPAAVGVAKPSTTVVPLSVAVVPVPALIPIPRIAMPFQTSATSSLVSGATDKACAAASIESRMVWKFG
jgi:hypothetical protein